MKDYGLLVSNSIFERRPADLPVYGDSDENPTRPLLKRQSMDNLAQSSHNCFSTAFLDRRSEIRRDEQLFADQLFKPSTLFVPVWRGKNLFSRENIRQPVFIDSSSVKRMIKDNFDACIFLGIIDNKFYFAVDLPPDDSKVPEKYFDLGHFHDLRNAGALVDKQNGELLVYAKGMTYWHVKRYGNQANMRQFETWFNDGGFGKLNDIL
jgi:hypothetical protein